MDQKIIIDLSRKGQRKINSDPVKENQPFGRIADSSFWMQK